MGKNLRKETVARPDDQFATPDDMAQTTSERLQNEGLQNEHSQKVGHTVFVSYSHKDEQEKDALLTHLAILEHIGLIDLWSDDRIGAGADWEEEINRAIERADVAILLVSANFLTSDFILRKEIPRLLARRQGEGLTIFPVIAKACAWKAVDWLTKMNIRPRNGIPVWSDKGSHADEYLAVVAEEVAVTIKNVSQDFKSQSQSVTSPIDTSTPSSSPLFEGTPSQHTPIIENPKQLSLPAEAEAILKAMFENYQRVVIIEEFGAGFSGSRIFMVRPIIDNATAHLRTVVKLASVSLIEKEWQAYKDCIRYRLPDAAQIQGQPVLLPDCEWGGLRYALQGGGGTFEIESLYSYLRRADIEDIRFVLKRLFKRLEQILQQTSPHFEFQLRTGYDRILPVNLLIEPTSQSETNPRLLTPNHLSGQSLKQGDRVQVSGFVITKVDPKYKSVTLNCPANHSLSSYCLRLKPIETVGTDRLGQIMDPIEGVVTETRQEKLEFEVRRAMGEDFDLTQETISWPGGPSLPNPLIKWPSLLQESRDVKVACIHGDLNMENILVDPETRDVSLIDFADARRDHVLHDFLRLETEVVTKIIPEILQQHNLLVDTICTFYQHLHTAIAHPGQVTASPNLVLEKPWAILLAIREMAGNYLWKSGNWVEYYQGLAFYLLGALKFKNLDEMDEAPAPLPKQVAFWGAVTVGGLLAGKIEEWVIEQEFDSATSTSSTILSIDIPEKPQKVPLITLLGSGAIATERGVAAGGGGAAGRDIHLHIKPSKSTDRKESTQFPSESLISKLKPVQQAIAQLLQSVQPKQSKPYFHHVERVIKYLTHFVLLLPPDKQLSEPEKFILIASAYLHDIGRYFPQPERTVALKNRRTTVGESDPEQIPQLVRRYYHELSWEWIKGSLVSDLYPSLGLTLTDPVSEIALVCLGHREVNLNDEKYRASGNGLQRIRPALLAALLSVADLLALISPKPDPKDLKQSTESLETQLSTWMRHYLERVSIQSGHIRFHYQLPTEDYSFSVRVLLSGSIQDRLRQVRNVLSENGVVIALDSSVAVGPSLEMPPDVLVYAKTLAQQRLTSVIATLGQPTKQGMPYQFTGLRGRPTLKWPDVTRAERYRCQLFDIEQHLLHQWETTIPEIILPIDQLEPGIQYEWITFAYRGRQRLKDRAGGIFWIIDDQTTRWIERQISWYESLESFARELVLGRILTDYGVYEEATSIYQTVLAQGNAMEQLQACQELIGLYENISRQLDRLGKRSRADGYLDAALVLANNLQAKL